MPGMYFVLEIPLIVKGRAILRGCHLYFLGQNKETLEMAFLVRGPKAVTKRIFEIIPDIGYTLTENTLLTLSRRMNVLFRLKWPTAMDNHEKSLAEIAAQIVLTYEARMTQINKGER